MTSLKGKSEFCFPETRNVSRGEAEGNFEGLGEKNCGLRFAVYPKNFGAKDL